MVEATNTGDGPLRKLEAGQDGAKRTFSPRKALVVVLGVAALGGAGALAQRLLPGGGFSECAGSQALARKIAPLAKGEIASVKAVEPSRPMPGLSFRRGDGGTVQDDFFKGRVVLFNLWATWCPPCRHEMPALDKLQAALGGPDFEVVAVNIDTRNLEKPGEWLRETGIANLKSYADPSANIFQDLKRAGLALGMPTTILIDRNGCTLAAINGPADWGGPDAQAFVKAALAR